MRSRPVVVPMLLGVAAVVAAMQGGVPEGPGYTVDFGLERYAGSLSLSRSLVPDGGNAYFSLRPGTFHRYEGDIEGEFVEIEQSVLPQTRVVAVQINGRRVVATTRIVEEREWIDGELAEVTLNYYTRATESNNIFHFGEDVDIYENGEIVSHEGSWLAGRDGALPGLLMPGLFLLGSRYYQELAPGIALDRADHVGMGISITTPAGAFEDCVAVYETDDLDPDEEVIKHYAPNVGLVADGTLVLVEYHN